MTTTCLTRQRPSSSQSVARRPRLAVLLVALAVLAAVPAGAQTVDSEPTDLKFEVINATTGEPGTIDRMTIEYVRNRRNGILDFEPSGSNFVAPGVPIKDGGEYIVAVWHQEVPYWWSLRGHQLKGQTTTLHVFDTTSAPEAVTIKGLNLVIRRQDTLLRLEYMLQVENATRPQYTINHRTATFELDVPLGASQIQATYRRGPDPVVIPAETHGGKQLSLAVPLTPGLNQIRVETVVPWQEGLEVPVGSNLAIAAWSLLSAPEWLEVRAMELESGSSDVPGFKRMTGPALEAGRNLPLRLFSGEEQAGTAEDLFTQDTPTETAATAAAAADAEDGGLPLPFVFVGVLIIIVIIAAVRRRQQ